MLKAAVRKPDVWELVRCDVSDLPFVSVVVVTYNSGLCLRDCLNALKVDPQVGEVIVVNNGNPSRDTGWLNGFCDENTGRFRLITGHGNVGFAKGANMGARLASGERILFLNPDAVMRQGSIAALEQAGMGNPEPWIVGGRIYCMDGAEQRGGRRRMLGVTSALISFTGLSLLERLHPMFEGMNRQKEESPSGPVPMPVVSGAMMYMSRRSWEILEGFDENYFLHVEDIDICRRAGESCQGRVLYTPLAGALHYSGTSKASPVRVEWEKAKGLGLYFRKFSKTRLESVLVSFLVPVFAVLLIGRTTFRTIGKQVFQRP